MYIDTHCHLNFKAFNKDRDEVIKRAKEKGITKIVVPGAKLDSSAEAIKIAQKNTCCFATVGIHPHHVKEYIKLGYNFVKIKLEELLKNQKVVAIGEIGLDYYQYKNYPQITLNDKINQKKLLLLQIKVALKNKLPTILHCREAHNDLLNIILKLPPKLKGVFHCFGGDKEHLKKILALGLYIGFDGNITYPENKNLRELIKFTPLDKLLLETDAPYLTPIPHRGERNEPSYIPLIAYTIAKIHNKTLKEIASQSTKNAQKLFNI